jgi:hypothetical protein
MITLEAVAADPSLVASLSPEQLPELYRLAARAEAELRAALLTARPASREPEAPDQLLTVAQAAERLGRTKDWLYRHAKDLPFTVRQGTGHPRFSARGLARYIRARQGS